MSTTAVPVAPAPAPAPAPHPCLQQVTEGWWELENHYALALWFSNETNLNGLSRGVFSITDRRSGQVETSNETNLNGLSRGVFSITDRRSGQVETLLNDSDKFAETFTEYTLDLGLSWRLGGNPGKTRFFEIPAKNTFYMLYAIEFFETIQMWISHKLPEEFQ